MSTKGVIFLDVDGVLISLKHQIKMRELHHEIRFGLKVPLDWYCIQNFFQLVKDTDSDVVLASGWRKYEEGIRRIKQIFSFYQLEGHYVGETDCLFKGTRTEEVLKYLESHPYKNFALLDDMRQFGLEKNQVVVNRQVGFTSKDAEAAKKILMKR